METKDIIVELRTKKGLSQEALAEKVFVTRQAVSRWENGETVPNTETLKLLSKLFDVSILIFFMPYVFMYVFFDFKHKIHNKIMIGIALFAIINWVLKLTMYF